MLDDLKRRCDGKPFVLSVSKHERRGRAPHAILSRRINRNSRGASMARIEVKSEITGTVWQVKSSVGDKVEEGDTLVVIESMKMEIPVITEDAGTVKEILVKEKDAVSEGQVVAVLEG
jgi:acetyl-CoA carboxylase biotin carboxyl carrier protein